MLLSRFHSIRAFQAKWRPLRAKKTRPIKNLEPRSDSIETGSRASPRPDRPAAAGTNHLAALVEEHIVVHHEQPFALDELVEGAGLQGDEVAGTRRNIVAPSARR